MAKYIEQEAAMDIFGDVPMWDGYYEPYTWEVHCAMVGAVKLIKEELNKVPAADVAPVTHGEWKKVDLVELQGRTSETMRVSNAGLRCSVCANAFDKNLLWALNYCPNCGTKMDGGVDND